MRDRRRWLIGAIIALSTFLHLWKLGLRPLAHDEAIDAHFSWMARDFGVMEYDPVYHGPLRFYLEGVVLKYFGITAGWTRVIAALAGIASTVVIACSRRVLGRVGAPVAAIVFTVSPTVLTVTRTGREDSLTGLVSLAMLMIVAYAIVDGPRTRHAVGLGALLAVSFGIKETTFIFGFAGACFLVGLAVVAWRRPDSPSRAFLRRVGQLDRQVWMLTAIAFLTVFMVIFTSGFRYAQGFESGLTDGIRYWLSQHEVERGSQKRHFYLTIYIAYEWLIIVLGAVGLAMTVRRRSLVGAWFATMAGVQLAVYSWAGEKFAWLALHPLIPAVLLAGLGAQHIADRRTDTSSRRILVGALGVVLAGTLAMAIRPAITAGDDPAELLVTVQTSADVRDLASRLLRLQEDGEVDTILLDVRDSGSWPWAWYLHGASGVEYVTIDPTTDLPAGYDAYIVSASSGAPPVPDGYTIERFRLRVWWLPDYSAMGMGDLARWFVARETWNPTGSSDQYVILREGASP
jgi:uncharacterized protein (TIGR03663 family)